MRKDLEAAESAAVPPDRSVPRIWFLRQRWRSMPRLFQIYLLIAAVMVIVVLGMVTLTGSFPFTGSWNTSPINVHIKQNDHQKKPDASPASGNGHELIPSPEQVVQSPNHSSDEKQQHEQIPKPKLDHSVVVPESHDDHKMFTFDPSSGSIEISYQTDLMHQSISEDQRRVIEAMKHSWDPYRAHAWGADHLKPITKTAQEWFHVGLTIIDSLDTILIMGSDMKYAYEQAITWVDKTLTFDIYRDVNCFEMTIRVLGGFLSSFHLTRDPILLTKAVDVADRLIHCFDSSSKVPFSDVNLRTKSPASPSWSPDSSLSEVSSMQIEFRDLSRVIKDPKYEEKSFATSQHLHDLVIRRKDPLLPMYINPNTGELTSSTITLGARGDSYYEYLLKQFLQTNISWLRDDYLDAVDAVKDRLMRRTLGQQKLLYISEILRKSSDLNPKMDHLTCFLPGTLALGHYHYLRSRGSARQKYRGHEIAAEDKNDSVPGLDMRTADRFADHLSLAEDLARTCYATYNMTATGLSAEITYFGSVSGEDEMYIKSADTHNLLRPEYVESLFYLYHMTGNQMYRDQGSRILSSFNKYSKVSDGGYTSIDDVRNPDHVRPRNMQESYWMAETLKYLFLLFSDDKQLVNKILDHYVFNTEGHLIPLRAI